ncbi:MAG TPA: hypothetical protein VGS21_07790 [Acidimicrobiales bacterium]|nr:hypothetical protein [Acidimicrobiales bacterium]
MTGPVVVAGPMPPPRTRRAVALLDTVGRLEGAGFSVTTVASPGLLALCRLTPVGKLVLQLEPGLVPADRVRRTAALALLAAALRRWDEVEIRLDSPGDHAGGPGGRAARWMWARATSVVVAGEDAGEVLRGQGVENVIVESTADDAASAAPGEAPSSREALQTLVRTRARVEKARIERAPADDAARMIAAAFVAPKLPLYEPMVRAVYERPALRSAVRFVLRRPNK